jgi:hypothetical protein
MVNPYGPTTTTRPGIASRSLRPWRLDNRVRHQDGNRWRLARGSGAAPDSISGAGGVRSVRISSRAASNVSLNFGHRLVCFTTSCAARRFTRLSEAWLQPEGPAYGVVPFSGITAAGVDDDVVATKIGPRDIQCALFRIVGRAALGSASLIPWPTSAVTDENRNTTHHSREPRDTT